MKSKANNRNNYNLFDYLVQLEQEELDQVEVKEEIIEDKDCYLGYENGPEHSILIHNYEFKSRNEHSYKVWNHSGIVIVDNKQVKIFIENRDRPSLDDRYFLEWNENTDYFRNLKDLIHFIKSDFKDKSLIYDQNDFYMEGNAWRYDD